MFRRFLVLFALVAALLLASACGSDDKDTDSTKKPATDDTAVDDTAADDTAADDTVVDDTDESAAADPSADGSSEAANEELGITPEFCAVAKDGAPETENVQDYVDYYEKLAPVAPEVLKEQVDTLVEKYRSVEEDGGTPEDAFEGDGVAGERLSVDVYGDQCP
jgi:hypothetical protein